MADNAISLSSKLKQNISSRLGRPYTKFESGVYPPQEPKELPEPPTTLTVLANRESTGLDDLHNVLPVSDPEDLAYFTRNLTTLLHGDLPHLHMDPRLRSVRIPRSNVQITPFQFNQACRILLQYPEQGLSGGILANSPGTGKSYIMLAVLLLRAMIFESKREVHQYWNGIRNGEIKVSSKNKLLHLPRATHEDDSRKCPSQEPNGIVCYCVRRSLTSRIADIGHGGVSVLQVPTETLSDWYTHFDKAILRLKSSPCKVYMLSNAPPARFRIRPSELKELLPELDSRAANLARAPEAFVFLTSLQGFQLLHAFSEPDGRFSLRIGLHMIDEAHQILNSERSTFMRMTASQTACDRWYVTGTPFRNGSLSEWVPAITLVDAERGSNLQALGSQLETIRRARDKEQTVKYLRDLTLVFNETLVLRHLPTSTMFNKPLTGLQSTKPMIISRKTPECYKEAVQTLASEVQSTLDPALDYAQAFLASSEARIGRDRLYFLSLFPAAARLMLDDPTVFDEETVMGLIEKTPINKLLIENQPELRERAGEIAQNSPKLDYIHEEIDRMLKDKRTRAADPHVEFMRQQDIAQAAAAAAGGEGKSKMRKKGHSMLPMLRGRLQNQAENLTVKKMVISTPTIATAAMLYLALSQARKDLRFVFYYSRAKRSHRAIALNKFNSILGDKARSDGQVFITNYAAAGTGINLQNAASYQVLTSRLPTKANETQAFARTNREGQRLAVTHKILISEDNPVDRITTCDHAGAEVTSNPFDIYEELTCTIPEVRLSPMMKAAEHEPTEHEPIDNSLRDSPSYTPIRGDTTAGFNLPSPVFFEKNSAAPSQPAEGPYPLLYDFDQLWTSSQPAPSPVWPTAPMFSSHTSIPPPGESSLSAVSPATARTTGPRPTSRMGRFREHLESDTESFLQTSPLLDGVLHRIIDEPRKKSKFSLLGLYKKDRSQ